MTSTNSNCGLKIKSYIAQANQNRQKSPQDIVIGDFVHLTCSGLKNDCDLSSQCGYVHESNYQTICKVVDAYEITDEELNSNNYLCPDKGGSESDDLPDNCDWYNLTEEQISTIYQLVTKITTPSGRVVFADRQGYDYVRYLYFWSDYSIMFASEIEEYKAEIQRKAEAYKQGLIEYKQSQRDAVISKYGEPVFDNNFDKNIKVIIERLIPNVGIKVTNVNKVWQERTNIWFSCNEDCKSEVYNKIDEIIRDIESNYSYNTGEISNDGWGGSIYRNAFFDVYGDKAFRIDINESKSNIKRYEPASKTTTSSTLNNVDGIEYVDYSDKSFAIIGDTKSIKDKLKELGGRFNFRLTCGAGWIFPKSKENEIRQSLGI